MMKNIDEQKNQTTVKLTINTIPIKELELKNKITGSIEKNFIAHFQPIVAPPKNKNQYSTIGYEALIRSIDHQYSPTQIISIAEKYGYIDRVGNFMIHQACHALEQMNNPNQKIFINASRIQFSKANFGEIAISIINQYDIHPSQVVIEMTEGHTDVDNQHTINNLQILIEKGINIAIDDLSLNPLQIEKQIAPFKKLLSKKTLSNKTHIIIKFDRESVARSPESVIQILIQVNIYLKSITNHPLQISSVCEGLETPQEIQELSYTIDKNRQYLSQIFLYMQGYFFGEPKIFSNERY